MAKVWFVRPENRLVALGNRPAYEGPLESFIWSLDLGLHRFYTNGPLSKNSEPPPQGFAKKDMVLVEVTPADITPESSYRVGFYSSPYSPNTAIARLGPPYQERSAG